MRSFNWPKPRKRVGLVAVDGVFIGIEFPFVVTTCGATVTTYDLRQLFFI